MLGDDMRCACTDCQEEECTDEECLKEQKKVLDEKKMRYFRDNKSLDDLVVEEYLAKVNDVD